MPSLGLLLSPSERFRPSITAPPRLSPLIRCAAQSAEISSHGIPHTFSVYVLKKMLKSCSPNWLIVQSWNDRTSFRGKKRV